MFSLRVYKSKERRGVVDRVIDAHNVIGKNIISVNAGIQQLIGLKVLTESGDEGKVESSFGKTGKIKLNFANGFTNGVKKGDKIRLPLRKQLFASQEDKNKIIQK